MANNREVLIDLDGHPGWKLFTDDLKKKRDSIIHTLVYSRLDPEQRSKYQGQLGEIEDALGWIDKKLGQGGA